MTEALCRAECCHALQNLGSDVAVKVDGKELEKDKQVSVGPGSKIAFGDEAVFQASSCTRQLLVHTSAGHNSALKYA